MLLTKVFYTLSVTEKKKILQRHDATVSGISEWTVTFNLTQNHFLPFFLFLLLNLKATQSQFFM